MYHLGTKEGQRILGGGGAYFTRGVYFTLNWDKSTSTVLIGLKTFLSDEELSI